MLILPGANFPLPSRYLLPVRSRWQLGLYCLYRCGRLQAIAEGFHAHAAVLGKRGRLFGERNSHVGLIPVLGSE